MSIPEKTKDTTVEATLDPKTQTSLLSIKDLRVWFELRRFGFAHIGDVHAVDGVSFELHHGESIAIVGESGCGKSSLMKTILALYKPTGGRVWFDKTDLSALSGPEVKEYRSKVGFIQQDPYGALPPFLSVRGILEEPLIVHGVKDKEERLQRITKVLEEVKMTPVNEFLSKFPHMLSGGQQQRVVIARAMIMNPKLLVADEPVSMLDASVRVEVLKLLRNLQEQHNLAVIYVTHDLSTVRYFSERIFVMYAGQIVEKGQVDKLVNNPLHPYSHALLEATSDPDAENAKVMKQIPTGEPPSLVRPPDGCRFHPRCPKMIPGVCDVEVPPEFNPEQGQYTSCWLYK